MAQPGDRRGLVFAAIVAVLGAVGLYLTMWPDSREPAAGQWTRRSGDVDSRQTLRDSGQDHVGHARAVLLQAFAKDVVHNIRLEPLRELLDEYIVSRFHE